MKNVQGVNDKYYNYYSKKKIEYCQSAPCGYVISFT